MHNSFKNLSYPATLFGGLSSRAYISTCMGTIAMFSMKDSFVDGIL